MSSALNTNKGRFLMILIHETKQEKPCNTCHQYPEAISFHYTLIDFNGKSNDFKLDRVMRVFSVVPFHSSNWKITFVRESC